MLIEPNGQIIYESAKKLLVIRMLWNKKPREVNLNVSSKLVVELNLINTFFEINFCNVIVSVNEKEIVFFSLVFGC